MPIVTGIFVAGFVVCASTGLYNGLITRLEECYRVCVCVCEGEREKERSRNLKKGAAEAQVGLFQQTKSIATS
jgi:hypothetical protein